MQEKGRQRVIGEITGKSGDTLFVALAGMHGNESTGVKALDLVCKMIEVEPITNPGFTFSGRFLALKGNLKALNQKKRFISRDLNRMWVPDVVDRVLSSEKDQLADEDLELYEILQCIWKAIEEFNPSEVVFLDLHTTTAKGGIFSLSTRSMESLELALSISAPVILDFLDNINGTLMQYLKSGILHAPVNTVVFEAGQHDDPVSVNRAVAATINSLKHVGMIDEDDVEHQHMYILEEYSRGLPKILKYKSCHSVSEGDGFTMLPGYENFQKIEKGEVLAGDNNGDIRAQHDGLLLMPLYQKQGEDGFFIVEELKELDNKSGAEKIILNL